ncbi:putative enzyme related to lactoylglutathione lyase [Microbacterium ginsengiterrae]|uniref:Putative enzyme related to lactoylglutathione lyase n=1 Tax=Microbacterium ginsengiterrae TaxID=546115 RepID=A0A7W9CC60_9MICO|nr:VOC family protein [Microbacterium ginsengiterrae]MBB5742894.1 putative enzyme related to lactoylglutathione lyase [Microbacterium ginsengiterrae]
MTVTGPDFISLQVSDLARSAEFYETRLGLTRQAGPPSAVVFATTPIAFAVRAASPEFDVAATDHPGAGVALWLHATDSQALHDELVASGVPIATAPVDGPFGRTFTFIDPDGYRVTVHDKA